MDRAVLKEKHGRLDTIKFLCKVYTLIGLRMIKNLVSPVKKFPISIKGSGAPVVAVSESDLWSPFDNKENWILTAGKVENLRIAIKRLHGLEVKANEVFSFWRHIGNPNWGKGYVIGREIREGCVLPTVAGGLCQLSNALYDAALKAHFEIIERHRHSKVIRGSLAEKDRDATVKWNFIDLRFKSKFDFRIEVELSSSKLMVKFMAATSEVSNEHEADQVKVVDMVNDCYSCGNTGCFMHEDRNAIKPEMANTAFILDEKWVEYDEYVNGVAVAGDLFVVPIKNNKLLNAKVYLWKAMHGSRILSTFPFGIYRALKLRIAGSKSNRFKLAVELDKLIANDAATKIPVEVSHLVISQNLLPTIFASGKLGGRTFDVLMTRLPLQMLQDRLDMAYSLHPDSATLNDFRLPQSYIGLETQALSLANKIITPHHEIGRHFSGKLVKLEWHIDRSQMPVQKRGKKILFPASALGRKGVYEMKMLAQRLNLELVIAGKAKESENIWGDVKTSHFDGNFSSISMVIYPTFVDHQPRLVLKAIGLGIPVITTKACGIAPSDNVILVNEGDFHQLEQVVSQKCCLH